MDTIQTISNPNEVALVDAVRQNPAMFGEIYQLYIQRIFRYLYSRVGNSQEAEDLTAQTFLAALETLDRFREDGCFAAWLFGIARNKVVDHYRKREKADPLEEVDSLPGENDPLTNIIRSERAEALAGLIRTLPEYEREILRLRYLAELSFDEMAHALKKNAGAVKKALYRLLQRLQHQLEISDD